MEQFVCVDCGQEFPNGAKLEICLGCKSRVCENCVKRKLCEACNLSVGPQGRNAYDKKKLWWNIFKILILILALINIIIGVPYYLMKDDYNPENSQSNFLFDNGIVFFILAIVFIIIFRGLLFFQLWIYDDWAKKELKKHSNSELNEQGSY